MISDHPTYVETDPTGRYSRLEEVLGKGAMKTVYRAIDEAQGIEVAWNQVKLNRLLQSPTELQRLYSEVHLLSTLSHPSIIRFHTSWIHLPSKSFNFITELFTSGTLRQYRKKYTRLNMRAVKSWARQILEGLVYLHQHDPPVIHRDLKCDNIFINGHLGQVKIGDLGLAAILRGSHSAHSVIGTPEFMAPELYEEDYNELVDVYSFGMCVLEMLTSEYPYSECTNPAQIYKKVTSGKLPSSFYRIQDFEAQRFIGKCLVCASKRLSAQELLLDPFLASEEAETLPLKPGTLKPFLNDIDMGRLHLGDDSTRTNMTITGKLNPEDDTIFLKVQIADKDGSVRNIYFPFDIISDTPIDVAVEMVKELEIQDWEPFEIADMIDGEISALVPNWKKWDFPHHKSNHTFSYEEEDHPFHSFSSCSSSQASLSELNHSHSLNDMRHGCDWLPDDHSDDTSSESSFHSATYSNLNYFSNDEQDSDHMKPAGKEQQQSATNNYKSTRFCPEENNNVRPSTARSRSSNRQCKVSTESHGASSSKRVALDSYKLTRNKSLVDVRSQLLHRSLVEEVNRRRLFKTVGAVENIGFQAPDVLGKTSRSKSTQNGKGQRSASRRI